MCKRKKCQCFHKFTTTIKTRYYSKDIVVILKLVVHLIFNTINVGIIFGLI